VLLGQRTHDGWRCVVADGAGVAGLPTDRELPLATTLGELLADRGPNATGPTDPADPGRA
jgi:hypothetical protein